MANFINSLYRGLQVLRCFTPGRPMLKLLDIVNLTGLPKTTVIRILKTLTSLNYIQLAPEEKKYFLGPEVMTLGFTVLSNMDLREIAFPHMQALSRISHQNISLGILDGKEVVFIERVKRQRILNIDIPVGSRLIAHRSSLGRVILAFLDDEQLNRVVRDILREDEAQSLFGKNGESLFKMLDLIREEGYAIIDEEVIPGLRTVSAPIINRNGRVEAAINMSVLSQVVSLDKLKNEYAPMVMETAQKIGDSRSL